MKYFYKVELESDSTLSITFPDLPQCFTQADDISQVYTMAEDVLHGVLESMMELGEFIPDPLNRSEEGLHAVIVRKDVAKKILTYKIDFLQKELAAL